MINKPKFKSCFHIEILESDVFLLSEKDSFLLKGRLYKLLAPLIDGHHTVDDLIDILQGEASAPEVYYALMLMEKKGYIIDNNDEILPNIAAYWDILNIDLREATSRLKATRVSVEAFGTAPTQEFISTLESLNIQIAEEGEIGIVLTDDYLQEGLAAYNQKAVQLKRPWMLVKPGGTMIWVGPIFYPGKTGCWECLAQRLRANRPVETFIQKQKGSSTLLPIPLAALPSTLQTGLNLAATEIIKWIVQGENKQIEGILVTFDTNLLKTQNHILVQRPQCSCCGKLDNYNKQPLPLVLESRKKTFTTDGGHRCFLT
jgi:ribosomal protein S12 methylthiotransferase accessory factor